jgi:hypothetical protein
MKILAILSLLASVSASVHARDFDRLSIEGSRMLPFPQERSGGIGAGTAHLSQIVFCEDETCIRAVPAAWIPAEERTAEALLPHLGAAWVRKLERDGFARPAIARTTLSFPDLARQLKKDFSNGGHAPGDGAWTSTDLLELNALWNEWSGDDRAILSGVVVYTDQLNSFVHERVYMLVNATRSRLVLIRRLDRYECCSDRLPRPFFPGT